MDIIINITNRLNHLIEILPIKIKQFSEEDFSTKVINKWSKKEILGHLCDSAHNNLHRFVKIQYEKQPFVVVSYQQDSWVENQDYQNIPIQEIVSFWTALNRQIIRVISKIPQDKLLYHCIVDDNQTITLAELIQDYMKHMDHHLDQIFGKANL